MHFLWFLWACRNAEGYESDAEGALGSSHVVLPQTVAGAGNKVSQQSSIKLIGLLFKKRILNPKKFWTNIVQIFHQKLVPDSTLDYLKSKKVSAKEKYFIIVMVRYFFFYYYYYYLFWTEAKEKKKDKTCCHYLGTVVDYLFFCITNIVAKTAAEEKEIERRRQQRLTEKARRRQEQVWLVMMYANGSSIWCV